MSELDKLTECIKKCVGSNILVIDVAPNGIVTFCSSGYFIKVDSGGISVGEFDIDELKRAVSINRKAGKANLN